MANNGPYDIGDAVELAADFTDLDGTPADPTEVLLLIRAPDDTVATIEQADLANPSTGEWTYLLLIDQSGWYRYRFEGSGAVTAAEEKRFRVRRQEVAAPAP
jgi:hypothetical protein